MANTATKTMMSEAEHDDEDDDVDDDDDEGESEDGDEDEYDGDDEGDEDDEDKDECEDGGEDDGDGTSENEYDAEDEYADAGDAEDDTAQKCARHGPDKCGGNSIRFTPRYAAVKRTQPVEHRGVNLTERSAKSQMNLYRTWLSKLSRSSVENAHNYGLRCSRSA